MNKIDRVKLRDNIIYFASKKGLKIGDIERGMGKPVGTISRWVSNNPDRIPLDVVYHISLLLEVTLDELINTDINILIKEQEIVALREQRDMIDKQIKELEGDIYE